MTKKVEDSKKGDSSKSSPKKVNWQRIKTQIVLKSTILKRIGLILALLLLIVGASTAIYFATKPVHEEECDHHDHGHDSEGGGGRLNQ